MLGELKTAKGLIVGAKRTLKAVKDGEAHKVFIARDADERVVSPIIEQCREFSVEVSYVDTMNELGKACGIDVGSSVATLVKVTN